jgi:2-(1,2-epoxy-1,2-dihydrophenyl)acetyl-CoA isomerase
MSGETPSSGTNIEPLVRQIYPALAAGDADALRVLLHPDFQAHFADGLPFGIGGDRDGVDAAITDGWWEIGRAYRMSAEPEEWIGTEDGRLVVRGFYRGTARATGNEVVAEFVHLWAGADGRLTSLRQLTDTVQWTQALTPNLF